MLLRATRGECKTSRATRETRGSVRERELRASCAIGGLPRVLVVDRRTVQRRAIERFGIARMVDEYSAVYQRLVKAYRGSLAR
jgi:hypothetical protein